MKKETEQKIQQLQMLEQGVQQSNVQKQQFQSQLLEVDSALEEMESSEELYKIVGNIMIRSTKDDLKKDLNSKKEILSLRIKTLDKQETQLKEKATRLQQEVMKELK